jgi:hypothetical protein
MINELSYEFCPPDYMDVILYHLRLAFFMVMARRDPVFVKLMSYSRLHGCIQDEVVFY